MDKDLLIFLGTIPWVVFLLVIVNFCGLGRRNPRGKNLKNLFLFVLFFAAIRYGIGYDYYSYKYVIEGQGYEWELDRWEPIPRMVALLARYTHYQLFFIISSILSIYPVYIVSKRMSVSPIETFGIYLLFPILFLDGLGIIRNSVAFSFILLMLYQIHCGKYLKSFICLIVACCFHTSAFIGVLFYPLYFFFHGKYLNISIYILSLVISSVVLPVLETYFTNFGLVFKFLSNIEKDLQGGGLFTYIVNIIAISNLIYWKRIASFSEENKVYLTLTNVGVCVWNAFLSIDVTTAQRLSTYFLFALVLLIPSYKYIFNSAIYRYTKIFFYVLFFSSIFLNLHAYYSLKRDMSNIPYQVFFLNPSDLFYHSN